MGIHDSYGRTFKTLRVSLTNVCNLACIYCVSGDHENTVAKSNFLRKTSQTLTVQDIVTAIKSIHALVDLQTVRLTGGEPTLYPHLLTLVKEIKQTGIPHIKMTTNGYLLEGKIEKLCKAGISSINVSLDAIESKSFYEISRRKNVEKVLLGLDKAIAAGVGVKINMVVMKGVNQDQILPLFEFSKHKNIPIRFLEVMKMGHLHGEGFDQHFFSQEEILKEIGSQYKFIQVIREKSSTANYWITHDGYKFGIIANESAPFCHDCDRLRLDSFGNIYGCLSENKAISIADCVNDEVLLTGKLKEALAQKQKVRFNGSNLAMIAIGG